MTITYKLSELDSVAAQLLAQKRSSIFLFYGEMGTGKTTLIKTLVQKLGVSEDAVSPTFSIVNEYRTQSNEVIYHFDLYRIEQEEELFNIGFEEYLTTGDWIFIEWPEIAADFLPIDAHKVSIRIQNNQRRILEIK